MKTVSRVDMARKDSNTTDEDVTGETVLVLIPPRSAKAESSSERPKPKLRKGTDIQRYFHSKRSQDFQIACDDTGTVAGPDPVQDASRGERPNLDSRQPLQPLSESALNRMQGELEAAGLQSSADELEVLRPHHMPRGDLDAPFPRRGQSVAVVDEQDERTSGSTVSPRVIPVARSLVPRQFPSSPRTNRPSPYPTPPSSGPLPVERLGVPLRSNGGRQATAPRQTQGRGPAVAHGPLQSTTSATAESPGAMMAPGSDPRCVFQAEREEGSRPLDSMDTGNSLFVPDRGYDLQQQDHGGEQQHCGPQAVVRVGSYLPAAGRPRLSHLNQQYSHMTQSLLMRSPSPTSEPRYERLGEQTKEDGPVAHVLGQEAQWPKRTVAVKGSTSIESHVDARHRLIQGRRGRVSGEHGRRLSSKRMPLEATPNGGQTQDTLGLMRASCDEIQGRMQHLAGFDAYVHCGQLAAALPLRDMAEAHQVESCLRLQVEAWRANEQMERVEVEYKLLSEAKGKRKRDA